MQISYTYGNNLPDSWGPMARGEGHTLACGRIPIRKLARFDDDGNVISLGIIPQRFLEQYEQNQQLAHCCRHPENHDIEAFYSCREEEEKGIPDVYILHCKCGRQHRRLMCGGGERPVWETR